MKYNKKCPECHGEGVVLKCTPGRVHGDYYEPCKCQIKYERIRR